MSSLPGFSPRPIRAPEAAVITQLLRLCALEPPLSRALLSSIGHLVVREHCSCGQHGTGPCESIFFDNPRQMGSPIAAGIGYMKNKRVVELIVWARGDVITYLELEPFNGARRPISLPLVETIQPYPDPEEAEDEDDDDG